MLACLAAALCAVADGTVSGQDYSNGYLHVEYECVADDAVLSVEEVVGIVSNSKNVGNVSIHTCQTKCSSSTTNNQACNYNGHNKDDNGVVFVNDQKFNVDCFCSGSCPHTFSDASGQNVCSDSNHTEAEDPNAFCGDEALLQQLCGAVPTCVGVRMAKHGKPRGYLLNDKCRDNWFRGSQLTPESSCGKYIV